MKRNGPAKLRPNQPPPTPTSGRRFWLWNSDPIVRLTGWVAAFTFVLTLVAIAQTWAFIQGQRSFISFSGAAFTKEGLAVGKPLQFVVTIKNSGLITAQLMDFRLRPSITLPPEPAYNDAGELAFVPAVANGEVRNIITPLAQGKPIFLNEEVIKDIEAGRQRLFIYGYIDYQDGLTLFGNHRTGFCFEYRSGAAEGERFVSCMAKSYTYAY